MDFCCQTEQKLVNNGVDIISDLPDSILEKIQSLLPTNDVIATSMLSKRWNSLSPFSNPPIKLDLKYSPLVKSQQCLNSFGHFVDKLFNSTLLNVSCIESLKLCCEESFGVDTTNSWICAALRLKVRELLIKIRPEDSKGLFYSLNGCTTLTRLELGEDFRVLVPDGFRLPNLKMLLLYILEFCWRDGNMCSKLIRGSPKLEHLGLIDCHWEEATLIESSSLKKLTITQSIEEYLELDVPNLEVFQCIDTNAKLLSSVKSLIKVHIGNGDYVTEIDGYGCDVYENVCDDVAQEVVELISACSNTVQLHLTSRSIHAIQGSLVQLPTFTNLSSLALGRMFTYKGWVVLARLLLIAPNLETLTFEEGFSKHECGYSGFVSSLQTPPPCLELHLKEINFKAFNKEEDELKLIEYFLRNGKVIQKLKIQCLPFKEPNRLLMLPMYSKIDFQLK